MKKTLERTQTLFEWYIDAEKERRKIFRQRLHILEQNYSEDIENKLLELNSLLYKDLTDLMNYCKDNMVSYHLTQQQRDLLYLDTKVDNTHTALRYN